MLNIGRNIFFQERNLWQKIPVLSRKRQSKPDIDVIYVNISRINSVTLNNTKKLFIWVGDTPVTNVIMLLLNHLVLKDIEKLNMKVFDIPVINASMLLLNLVIYRNTKK